MISQRFIVGSQAFFKDIKGYSPKDIDVLYFEDDPKDYKMFRQVQFKDKCVFNWLYTSKQQLINVHKDKGMALGKFLVPEVASYIGFTIEDLKDLRPLFDNLDEKHLYEAIIADAYINNNAFTLTEEQLNQAYQSYIKSRTE